MEGAMDFHSNKRQQHADDAKSFLLSIVFFLLALILVAVLTACTTVSLEAQVERCYAFGGSPNFTTAGNMTSFQCVRK